MPVGSFNQKTDNLKTFLHFYTFFSTKTTQKGNIFWWLSEISANIYAFKSNLFVSKALVKPCVTMIKRGL